MTIRYLNRWSPDRCAIVLASCIAISACNDNTELVDIIEDGEAGVISLKASSDEIQLAVGQSYTLSATAVDDSGSQTVFTDSIQWISQNDNVATVDGDGTVTAIAPGEVAITYQWRRISGTTTVQVTSAELASIAFSTTQLEANECSETSLTAAGLYTDGSTQALSAISQWSSDNETVALVVSQDSSAAELRLINSGIAQITMTSGPITDSVQLTVTDTLSEVRIASALQTLETGSEQALEVTGLFADGTEAAIDAIASFTLAATQPDNLTGIVLDTHPEPATTPASEPEASGAETVSNEVILASSATLDIVQLQDTTLVIRAKQPGTSTLTVACGGQTSELSLTVTDPPQLESLSFTATDVDIEPGDTQSVELIARYSDGSTTVISDDVQWTIMSGDTDSFELDTLSGQLTANSDITVEQSIVLQASYETLTASIEVLSNRGVREEVITTQLYYEDTGGERVPLTASKNTLSVGDTLQLTLKSVYNSGREEFSVTDLYWSNLNPDIASIDGSGLLTARAAGISSISAITNSVVATFQFTVNEETSSTPPDSP